MSHNDDQNLECPLCMEPFEMDDFTFFPCTCGYQICRFCWHRIRTDENGLCPACRKQYPEDPADFKPISAEEIQKIKNEKRQRDQKRKHRAFENRKYLAEIRVVQKNLVFVVGLPPRLADPEILKKHHYFGKYGRIHKVVVNHATTYAGSQGPSASAYVTYYRPEDALNAIKTVNQILVDGRVLKASLGTTKYCSYFLKNQQCPKADCMYLHEFGEEAASFTREDMKQGKHQEYERHLQDIYQISSNKTDPESSRPHKKSHSCKDTWPSAPQNPKAAQGKDSKTDKQNRSKYKYTQVDIPKRKTKVKPDDSQSNISSNKSSTKEEDTSFPKRTPRPRNLHLKDSVNSNQTPLQRTGGLPACGNTASCNKQLAINEMNNRNVEKTLLHIGGQCVYNQSMKCTEKSVCDCPSFSSSPTSSSSSSLFTPFGSFSSNFLSSSPPLYGAEHLLSLEEFLLTETHDHPSTNVSPQNFIDTVTESHECETPSCADSNINLGGQLKTSSVSPPSGAYSGPTSEVVVHENELKAKAISDILKRLKQVDPSVVHENELETKVDTSDILMLKQDDPSVVDENELETKVDISDILKMLKQDDPSVVHENEMETMVDMETKLHVSDILKILKQDNPSVIQENELDGKVDVSDLLKMLKQDDDLDFDPWEESSKGLGDLIAKEETINMSAATSIPPPGFSYGPHVPSRVPKPLVTPPPGFIRSLSSAKYDYSQGKFVQAAQPERKFPPNPGDQKILPGKIYLDEARVKQDDFRALFPNINITFGKRFPRNFNIGANLPTGENNWQLHVTAATLSGNTTVPIWTKTIQQVGDPNRCLGQPCFSQFALRGQLPTSSQCPPPGFLVPSRPPYQHVAVNQNEPKSKGGLIE